MTRDDAVVQRVRAARRQIVERCGGDRHRLLEWAKRIEAARPERVVSYGPPMRKSQGEAT